MPGATSPVRARLAVSEETWESIERELRRQGCYVDTTWDGPTTLEDAILAEIQGAATVRTVPIAFV